MTDGIEENFYQWEQAVVDSFLSHTNSLIDVLKEKGKDSDKSLLKDEIIALTIEGDNILQSAVKELLAGPLKHW